MSTLLRFTNGKRPGYISSTGLLLLIILLLFPSRADAASLSTPGIAVNGMKISYEIFSIFLLPGQHITITAERPSDILDFTFENRRLDQTKPGYWTTKAPEKTGTYILRGQKRADRRFMTVNVFVLEPSRKITNQKLNNYRIGSYPPPRQAKKGDYQKPGGFIRVTKENEDMLLTPHFKLRQFLCKQKGGYPKYVIVRESLLVLLEKLLAEVRQQGYIVDTFGFISGYRTPFYNRKIKNVQYSRHIYGDAADIFIDRNQDGRMDDLDGNGVVNIEDARVLYDIANQLERSFSKALTGGIGLYGPTTRHSGFVHIDTRGYAARW